MQRIIDRQNFLKEEGIPLDAMVFLSVGELHERKNHRTAIKAFAGLENKKILFMKESTEGVAEGQTTAEAGKPEIEENVGQESVRKGNRRWEK